VADGSGMERPQPEMGTQNDTLFPRIAAFVVDAILIGVIGVVLVGVASALSESLAGAIGGLAGILGIAYFIYMEATYGQTVGKRLLGIVVVTEDGQPIGTVASLVRNLLRIIDNLPALYLLGIVVILLSDDGQRIGDILADTVVVRTL